MAKKRRRPVVQIAGLDLHVTSEQELLDDNPGGDHVYVCVRVTSKPLGLNPLIASRVFTTRCAECMHQVLVDPQGLIYPLGMVLLCEVCAKPRVEADRQAGQKVTFHIAPAIHSIAESLADRTHARRGRRRPETD